MRTMALWLSLLLVACNDGDGDTNGDDTNGNDDTGDDTSTDTDTGGDTDTDVNNNWTGPDNGYEVPNTAPDEVITGNLSDGSVLSSTSWMDDGGWYCGSNFGESFTGAHAFHRHSQGPSSDVLVRLVPDAGLDMSLNLIQQPPGTTALPPAEAAKPGSGDCQAMFDDDGNPGQPEVGCVAAFTGYSYSVLIEVAGAEGLTSGAYRIEIWDAAYTGCPP